MANLNVLHNPIILYLVGLIAVGNLYLFFHTKQFVSVGLFIISALFVSYYTNNSVAILVVAMVLCNIISVLGFGHIDGFRTKGKGQRRHDNRKKEAKKKEAAAAIARGKICDTTCTSDLICKTLCRPA